EPSLDGDAAWSRRAQHDAEVLDTWRRAQPSAEGAPIWIGRLVLAADQFLVRRPLVADADGATVIAGYHWFGDWGRDTMIALPGLTLATGRPELARKILTTFARFVDRGMLPKRFPDGSGAPECHTPDPTASELEALRAEHQPDLRRAAAGGPTVGRASPRRRRRVRASPADLVRPAEPRDVRRALRRPLRRRPAGARRRLSPGHGVELAARPLRAGAL